MQPRRPRLLSDSLTLSAESVPDKAAIVVGQQSTSYRDLHSAASRLAAAFKAMGIRRGDRVAIYMENSVEVAVSLYASLYAGAAFLIINPQTKADKLRYILGDSGATALVSDSRLARIAQGVVGDLSDLQLLVVAGAPVEGEQLGDWISLESLITDHATISDDPKTIPLDLAALVYTSGSTGNPKGVMLSHQNMIFAQESVAEYLRLSPDDRIMNFLPLAFDYGLYQLLMCVHLGATLVLERSFAFPMAIVKRVIEQHVTVFPGVPTVYASLLALHRTTPLSMPTVRIYTNTAAHLPDEYVPQLEGVSPGALIFKMYGLTECKRVCYLEPELVLERPASVGKPIPGTETYILDDAGREVPPGETGVLYVRGPHVMLGYWNLPLETSAMLKEGKYPGERVLCTHDFFKKDEDGFLYFVGRSDDIIKSRGEKVSPTEVENALAAIPGIRESAVVGVVDMVLGQAVRAYVVLDSGSTLTEAEVKRKALERLESFMVPRDVLFVEDLPKTGTGKVRKKSLLEAAE